MSRQHELLKAAAEAVAAARTGPVRLLLLGGDAPAIETDNLEVIRPGSLGAEALSDWLGQTDLFLAPFTDGISVRRSSVSAALQHGLPVVSTLSEHTDAVLTESGALALAPVGDYAAFTTLVVELAMDGDRRRHLGQRSMALYERVLAWPRLAEGMRQIADLALQRQVERGTRRL